MLNRLFDQTFKAATSWVGLLATYIAAVILILTNFRNMTEALAKIWPAAPPWLGPVVILSLPLLALVLHTIPSLIEQRRIKRYSQLSGASQPGYFTLRPRESEAGFEVCGLAESRKRLCAFRAIWIAALRCPVQIPIGGLD